jgi:hypothetical protein
MEFLVVAIVAILGFGLFRYLRTEATDTSTATTGSRPVIRRFRFQWVYSGAVSRGDTVQYSACVDIPGDVDGGDDCDSVTVTAR